MIEREVTIRNRAGLHTRPAASIVKLAAKFKSEFFIEKDSFRINGKYHRRDDIGGRTGLYTFIKL